MRMAVLSPQQSMMKDSHHGRTCCSEQESGQTSPLNVRARRQHCPVGATHLVGPPHWVTDITVSPAAPATPTRPSPASPAVSPAASPAAPAVPVAASRAKPPDQTMINISVYIRWYLEMLILHSHCSTFKFSKLYRPLWNNQYLPHNFTGQSKSMPL